MSEKVAGAWHIRPMSAQVNGRDGLKQTWTGPIDTQIYGQGLTDLCDKTRGNLNRLSQQIQKMDPCTEYGIKHWHPNNRPKTAVIGVNEIRGWHDVNVMFGDNKTTQELSNKSNADTDTYNDPVVKNTFCYLCTTMEEHQRHMLHHKPKKRYTGRARVHYIAPAPKQKSKDDKESEAELIRERLYKVEVFTSNLPNAGTDAKVYIYIKGTANYLPRYELKKSHGCAKLCFVRASKEVFHIKGPYLGNLQLLTIEHDGTERKHAWHFEKVHITDVKAMKTWVFTCQQWLSIYEKPLYSNTVDLEAIELQHPPTDYAIEIHTGKQKLAGTDSSIFITLYGEFGASKKIMLKDSTSDKKLFERNSIDRFQIRMYGIGELKKIRIEHDGNGFAAGWFLDRVMIRDSERPAQNYYFMYGGWIAVDEGDGRLWREISAKKTLPKKLTSGVKTKYSLIVKTGDVRYAGTDANVFIQMAGDKGITNKLTLDNPKNNFERNMVDNFELDAINVGSMQHIVIGHDNANPGAGWFLEKVTIRRYIPREEQAETLKKIKKRLKKEKRSKRREKDDDTEDSDSDAETGKSRKLKYANEKYERKDKHGRSKSGKKKDLFSVSSSEDSSSDSSDDEKENKKSRRRPQSAKSRDRYKTNKPGSSKYKTNKNSKSSDDSSEDSDSETELKSKHGSRRSRRGSSAYKTNKYSDDDNDESKPRTAAQRRAKASYGTSKYDSDDSDSKKRRSSAYGNSKVESDDDEDNKFSRKRANKYERNFRSSSANSGRGSSSSKRHVTTSASSLRSRRGGDDDDIDSGDLRVPLYEECTFICNKWLATDEDDGLCVRELKATDKHTFYKDK